MLGRLQASIAGPMGRRTTATGAVASSTAKVSDDPLFTVHWDILGDGSYCYLSRPNFWEAGRSGGLGIRGDIA